MSWPNAGSLFVLQDVMAWIIENNEDYQLHHCQTLAANAFRANTDDKKTNKGPSVEEALELVAKMFHDPTTRTNISSNEESTNARIERV